MNDQPRFFSIDTLVNLVAGFGTSKDKSCHSQYLLSLLTQEQLDAAYRQDWIARKVVAG